MRVPKKLARGFTLIELMIVVAIIGILAAIALPMYERYVIQSRVSEVLFAASAARTPVTEAAQANQSLSSAGVGLTIGSSQFVESGTVGTDGTIAVSAKTAIGTSGVAVTLTPSWNGVTVNWSCAATPVKYAPGTCR